MRKYIIKIDMALVIQKNLRSRYINAYWCMGGGVIAKYNEHDTAPWCRLAIF